MKSGFVLHEALPCTKQFSTITGILKGIWKVGWFYMISHSCFAYLVIITFSARISSTSTFNNIIIKFFWFEHCVTCKTHIYCLWSLLWCLAKAWWVLNSLPHIGQLYTKLFGKCLDSIWFLTSHLALFLYCSQILQ